MKKCHLILALLFTMFHGAQAQSVYSLDSLRHLALTEGRTLEISRTKIEKAEHTHQAARTNFLPKIELAGG